MPPHETPNSFALHASEHVNPLAHPVVDEHPGVATGPPEGHCVGSLLRHAMPPPFDSWAGSANRCQSLRAWHRSCSTCSPWRAELPTQSAKRGPRALIQAVKGMIAVSFLGACRSGLPNEIDYDPNGDAGDGGDVESGDAALFRVTVGVQMADATATETNPKGTPRDGRGV
jgi:hypothetical protein